MWDNNRLISFTYILHNIKNTFYITLLNYACNHKKGYYDFSNERVFEMKKLITAVLAVALSVSFVACSPEDNSGGSSTQTPSKTQSDVSQDTPNNSFDATQTITVISREDGSGTRGAFVELVGVLEKDADGNKIDKTTEEAIIVDKTDVTLSQVAGNETAIGYVSVGSLSENVKALKIDGVEATNENIKSGAYKVARPFFLATKDTSNVLAQDFISFILSKEGQEIVSGSYIAVNDTAEAYAGSKPSGKLVISGSSSVTPVMEKLVEAYKAINTEAAVEVQQTDSSAGMQAAIDGVCDIGMASRELKDSEKEKLQSTQIAIDGIAVIVNNTNTTDDITTEAVKNIFTGAATTWDQVK